VTVYPKTRESTIERRALDAAGQWAEVAQRCEAECQRLRERVAELEAESDAWEKAFLVRLLHRCEACEAELARLQERDAERGRMP
jgi:hypothetical protein